MLRPGGRARVMIYHRRSLVGLMLWLRYGLLAGRPGRSLDEIYAAAPGEPGHQGLLPARAHEMFAGFSDVRVTSELGPGDLLQGAAGQRHRGALLDAAQPVVSALGRQALPLRLRLVPADRGDGAPAARGADRERGCARALWRSRSSSPASGASSSGARASRPGGVPVDYQRRRLVHARHAEGRARRAPDAARPGGSPRARRALRRELERASCGSTSCSYGLAGAPRARLGLFPAANLLVLLASVLAALSFQAVSRRLGARPEWAFAGACVFALSPFFFYRLLSHLTLSFYWPIPLADPGRCLGLRGARDPAGIASVLGRDGDRRGDRPAQHLLCGAPRPVPGPLAPRAGTRAASSEGRPLVARASRRAVPRCWPTTPTCSSRPPARALRPALSCARTATWSDTRSSRSSCCCRSAMPAWCLAGGREGVPAQRPLPRRARLGLSRPRGRPRPGRPRDSNGAGGARPPATPRARSRPGAIAWILAYAVVGGLNGLLGLAGFVWLRATNRTSIWILAVVLLWGATAISRAAWTRRRRRSVVAAALLAALTLVDQLPPRTPPQAIRERGAVLASDAVFTRSLEAALPAGAMLFQLPVVDFPEGQPVRGASLDYEHLRLYLHSTQLHFSYGSRASRATRGSGAWRSWRRSRWRTRSSAWASRASS